MNFLPLHLFKGESGKGVFSPIIYSIYTQSSYSESNHFEGINIHDQNINNFRYADDTVLIVNDQDKLQEIVTRVKEESSKAGLDMNVKKTKRPKGEESRYES